MQIAVTIATTFAAAHRLPDHEGKCFRLHGHTYGLEVTVAGAPQDSGPATGMVIDFADLRRQVDRSIIDKVDHQLLNDVFDFVPTVEALGAWMFERLLEVGIPVSKIRLSEGPNSWVEVTA